MSVMGKVLCADHGDQYGKVACDHVRKAAIGPDVLNTPCFPIVGFTNDVFDDGSSLLTYTVCEPCAEICEIRDGDVTSLSSLGEGHIHASWAPICGDCIEDWVRASSVAGD